MKQGSAFPYISYAVARGARIGFSLMTHCLCHERGTRFSAVPGSTPNIVSRELVKVALTLAALNDLDVKMHDIGNTNLTAPITEKVWTVLVPEFGDDAEKCSLIVRALYGLHFAGAAFRKKLDECMKHLGWNPCCADRELWMKAEKALIMVFYTGPTF
jgi:hypothetical protein